MPLAFPVNSFVYPYPMIDILNYGVSSGYLRNSWLYLALYYFNYFPLLYIWR